MKILQSFLVVLFALIPSRFISAYFFDKKTQFWQFEATWFLVFLVMFELGRYLIRRRVPTSDSIDQ